MGIQYCLNMTRIIRVLGNDVGIYSSFGYHIMLHAFSSSELWKVFFCIFVSRYWDVISLFGKLNFHDSDSMCPTHLSKRGKLALLSHNLNTYLPDRVLNKVLFCYGVDVHAAVQIDFSAALVVARLKSWSITQQQ